MLSIIMLLAALPHAARGQMWSAIDSTYRSPQISSTLGPPLKSLGPTLCQEKANLMMASTFAFYRANNPLYYSDLKRQNIVTSSSALYSAKTITWIQGDMHMLNMGIFDNDSGKVIFDLNDFDESWVANFLYDMYRLSTSFILVARDNGLSDTDGRTIVKAFVNKYFTQLNAFKGNNNEDSFDWGETNAYGILNNAIADAKAKDSRQKMLNSYSTTVSGTRKFMSNSVNPDLQAVTNATLRTAIINAIQTAYPTTLTSSLNGNTAYFQVQDVAQRLNAGLGSYGVTRYYVIVEGATTDSDDDRLLDVKLQSKPSYYNYVSQTSTANTLTHNGQRAAIGNKDMLSHADDHLGWATISGGQYSVRERSPFKESLTLTGLTAGQLTNLAEQYGIVLAAAHARADNDYTLTPDAPFESVAYALADTTTKKDNFGTNLANFGVSYANQVALDASLFQSLYNSGSIC